MRKAGFTIVELIVVIVVIVILASITLMSFSFMQDDAMDVKIRSTVKTAGDALALYESRNNTRVSSAGYFGNSGGIDTLVPAYLKTGYRDDVTSKNVTDVNHIFRWYPCADGSGGFVVFASLNNPTDDDISTFNKLRTACFATEALRNTNAPASGATPRYNYAQLF